MAGPGRLSVAQASAIRLLVSGAVPGMSAESVSVLDPSGVVIAADDSEAAGSNRISALKAAREQQLRRAVTDLLEPLIGHEKISVAAAVELDASREVSHEEKFDPLSQIERSKQTQVDQDATNETKAQDAVSVSQNLPNPNAPQGVEGGRATTNNSRSGQTVNYEISSVHSDRVREAGELRRITIAVVVDGTESDKGQYKPRSPEELERLSELIRSAVGFDANRGDRVTVETMHFVRNQRLGEGAEAEAGEFAKLPITGIAIGGAVLLIAGGVLMMRVRKSRQLALAERNPSASLPYMLSEQQSGVGQPQPGQLSALADGSSGMASSSHYALTVGRGEPALQALFGSLSEIVDARPDEALSTLRSWLAEAA
jgi:flagellar M-ring protein FliF